MPTGNVIPDSGDFHGSVIVMGILSPLGGKCVKDVNDASCANDQFKHCCLLIADVGVSVNVPEAIALVFDVPVVFANSHKLDMFGRGLFFAVYFKLIFIPASLFNEALKELNILVGFIPLDVVPPVRSHDLSPP